MDADNSRPVRRPPAAAAKRETVRRPRKLARPELAAGPPREVRDLLYDLHEKAGRPALEGLEKRIADDDRLDGSPKKDLIHRIISRGGPAALADVRAVARTLARACGQDEHTVDAQVTLLMRSPERPSVPGPLLAPRSVYLAQVRQIAPPELVGREAELAELMRFCLGEQAGAYVWWQAGPWAGKSALLSTFVVHPPAAVRSRVQVVAFFITTRLAAQDTRQAFTAVVGEQLAALTGQQVPAVIDESLREAWLLDQLTQAAESCRQRGVRLVLVVDGLDEDRSTISGAGGCSIAALLPGVAPAGMRVIVAGRPDPPVPDDVPDWHPLRDQGIIRPLTDSPHARDLQRLGQTELKRLLTGSPVEQDLLGLLTAARGGLSGDDLHELTGAGLIEVEEVLHTVAGRTFTRRPRQWAAADGPPVYLLGHEELAAAARRYLGETRLAGYRDRLHAWADRYRRPIHSGRPWPQDTPEYLLLGYPRMLSTAGDVSRLVALVTDAARHDRMLDLTGADAAALAEITTCQDLVLAGPGPVVEAMLLLCIRRNNLADRNRRIPTGLPAVWAALGQPARAEALARSITRPDEQARALIAVAEAIAAAGDPDRAETVARSITYPDLQAWALIVVARAFAAAGDPDRAETVARSLADPYEQVCALTVVAEAIAAGGVRTETVGDVVGTAERARQLAERAETLARLLTDWDEQDQALAAVAQAFAAAGEPDRAAAVARSITDSYEQDQALTAVAEAFAAAGEPDRAAAVARSLAGGERALTAVARAFAAAGDPDRAATVARSLTRPDGQARALTAVAEVFAAAGDPDRAAAVACSLTDQYEQARALAAVAGAFAAAGEAERARQFAERAATVARSLTDPDRQAWALTAVARAFAAAGDPDRAAAVARSLSRPEALAAVAEAFAAAGEAERAWQFAERAATVARSLTDPDRPAWTLAAVAEAIAAAGDPRRARQLAVRAATAARSLTSPYEQAWALAAVAGAFAAAGEAERARQLAERAATVARSLTGPDEQAEVLAAVARAFAAAGDRAAAVARSITSPGKRAEAPTLVAEAIAAADRDRAATGAWSTISPDEQVAVARAIAAAGDLERAGRLMGMVLAVASWRVPLPVLAEHWPQAVLRCADELSGNERSRN